MHTTIRLDSITLSQILTNINPHRGERCNGWASDEDSLIQSMEKDREMKNIEITGTPRGID